MIEVNGSTHEAIMREFGKIAERRKNSRWASPAFGAAGAALGAAVGAEAIERAPLSRGERRRGMEFIKKHPRYDGVRKGKVPDTTAVQEDLRRMLRNRRALKYLPAGSLAGSLIGALAWAAANRVVASLGRRKHEKRAAEGGEPVYTMTRNERNIAGAGAIPMLAGTALNLEELVRDMRNLPTKRRSRYGMPLVLGGIAMNSAGTVPALARYYKRRKEYQKAKTAARRLHNPVLNLRRGKKKLRLPHHRRR